MSRILTHAASADDVPRTLKLGLVMDVRGAQLGEDAVMDALRRGQAVAGVVANGVAQTWQRHPVVILVPSVQHHPVIGVRQLLDQGGQLHMPGGLINGGVAQRLAAQPRFGQGAGQRQRPAGAPGPAGVADLDAQPGAACAHRAIAQVFDPGGGQRAAIGPHGLTRQRPTQLDGMVHEMASHLVRAIGHPGRRALGAGMKQQPRRLHGMGGKDVEAALGDPLA